MRSPVATAIAIGVGLVVLTGYLFPVPVVDSIRALFLDWAIILAAVAGLVAIINLFKVHWRKLNAPRERDYYSLIFILGFIFTLLFGLIYGPADPQILPLVTHIQLPIEASLVGLLSITLTVAAFRLLSRRRDWMSGIFLASALVFLLIGSGLLLAEPNLPFLRSILSAVNVLPTAGARGILLGIALGSLLTGLRILMGYDRPYSG